jgi:hypothetical protein
MKIRLNSSAVTAVDYDPGTGRLKIWFPSNGPYSFHRVPERVYLGLLNAGSKGTYYTAYIRGRYQA